MNCIVPFEPVTLEIGGETLQFQIQQQMVRQAANFIRDFDTAITAELNAEPDFFELEGAVESAPLVEDIICKILLPVDGGERLTAAQARELRLDQRMSILLGQIQLNRLDQYMEHVMKRVFELQADRIARALVEIEKMAPVEPAPEIDFPASLAVASSSEPGRGVEPGGREEGE